ncbi:MAG: YlcI/YnfO family protein [Actinomycetota bacterium]
MAKDTTPFQLRMPAELHEALTRHVGLTGESMNSFVCTATQEALRRFAESSEFNRLLKQVRDEYRAALDKLADL